MTAVDGSVRLRASLVWHDEVMGDVVFNEPGALTLGDDHKATFTVPDLGLPKAFPIISKGNRGYLLTLGKSMRGRFSVDGTVHEVKDWVRRDHEGGGDGGFRATPIGGNDWGVIELDASGVTKLFFQFVPVEPPLPTVLLAALELMMPALAFSVILHAILLGISYRFRSTEHPFIWPGPRSLTGNYLVTRIDPIPPPEIKKSGAAEAAAAKGDVKNVKTATKGREGKAGGEGKEPRARDPDAIDTPPEPPKVALFEDKNRRVIDNVIQNELATSLGKFTGLQGPKQRGGVGAGEGKGIGFGPGDGTGTTRGSRGDGPGGGGEAQGDFQSQGKIDSGDVRPDGPGGAGRGVKEVAVVGTGTATGDFGGLSKEEIDRVIRARQGLIKACYQKELNRSRGLGGKLVVNFVIAADGSVKSTRVDPGRSTLRNDAVEACVRNQIARLRFPAKGGGVVNYPFIFSQG